MDKLSLKERVEQSLGDRMIYSLEAYEMVWNVLSIELKQRKEFNLNEVPDVFRKCAEYLYGCLAPEVLDYHGVKTVKDLDYIVSGIIESDWLNYTRGDPLHIEGDSREPIINGHFSKLADQSVRKSVKEIDLMETTIEEIKKMLENLKKRV